MVDNDHSTNFFGGVTIYRPGEAAQKTQSKPHFASMELNVHKLVVLCAASDELIEDSPQSIETLLNTNVPAAIAFQADADFINGTGVGMPIGVLNAANPALEAVTAELGQVADTIVWRNILSMYQSFFPVNENAVTWLANRDTFKELATMGLPIGTGGVPVWMPADGSVGRPHNTLMGYPVIFTEKCATLGDQGDIALVDWSQYYIGDKGGVKTASSMHLWFDYDLQAFRFVLRNDGRPAWNSALTPYLGANDLSPFVVLAAR